MITLRIEGKENLIACHISELEAAVNDEMQRLIIYYKGEYLGPLISMIGMSEEEFMAKIKMRY